ncbi:MAG: DUF3604 domain-containing protein [Deltaproteobacteria bacterium]|nr:DUF3604 domain-containing protein [Deltaproteobacteria bacterium]
MKRILGVFGLLLLAAAGLVFAGGEGWLGDTETPGTIRGPARSATRVANEASTQLLAARALAVDAPKQVLFGDLHVHTSFSFDAFMLSLPAAVGEGAHPPADACDFARHCSALDFWSINDHAEGLTSANWLDTVESVRQCNAVAGDATNPDTVAFLGWEWTQIGATPADHFGHKNIVLRGLDDADVPARPIAAGGAALRIRESGGPNFFVRAYASLLGGHERYRDLARYFAERDPTQRCAEGVPVRELPADCLEVAETPAVLFDKLDDWGVDSFVIPHGTTWGMYTPPGSTWDKQLAGRMQDDDRQTLLEVFSGHGDSEQYRDFRDVEFDAEGKPSCPPPQPDYLPSCWRAGEIIRERCLAENTSAEECDERAARTRQLAADAGVPGHLVVDGESAADWLDAGQCRDCDQPAFNYRPGGSAQYIAALGSWDDEAKPPRRFRFGFVAASDNHFARPGTGFKQKNRRGNTESNGEPATGLLARWQSAQQMPPSSQPRPFDPAQFSGFQLTETERQGSFFMMGGLTAVHASGRDRDSIWSAFERREVYGTTGQRTLLWFDLVNAPGGPAPMGAQLALSEAPVFRVRAQGAFEQQPGCPDESSRALGPDGIERLCKGECHNPSDVRRPITRIEIVRIRPQQAPGEAIAELIDDPFLVHACAPDSAGCTFEFTDAEFPTLGREALYYARVYEAPDRAINAGGIQCERDEAGNCVKAQLCPGAGGVADDCLAEREPRAWSSPIYLNWRAPAGQPAATAVASRE